MIELSREEVLQINGGFHITINLGTALASLAIGAIGGGPVGLGYAVAGIIIAQGINSLNEMQTKHPQSIAYDTGFYGAF